MTKHFRSRYPRYPDDSDYKTNASSYYEDLARKSKLIEILAEKIYGYEKVLAENLAEIERVLNAVIDKIGEGFNQEIVELLEQWVLDGTLDHIINETLMNQKADKSELLALDERLTNDLAQIIVDVDENINGFKTGINQEMTDLDNRLSNELNQVDGRVSSLDTKLEKDFNTPPFHAGIRYEKHFDVESQTKYVVTHIPMTDETGKKKQLKLHADYNNYQTGEDFLKGKDISFLSNAGMSTENQGNIDFITIKDGQILSSVVSSKNTRHTLGIKADGTLKSYPPGSTAQQLLADGVVNAITAFSPLIENYQLNMQNINYSDGNKEKHPRQIIGQRPNGDLVYLTTSGRGVGGYGMSYLRVAQLIAQEGVSFAYALDGGGSNQTFVRGIMVNDNTNREPNTTEGEYLRARESFFYIEDNEKQAKDKSISELTQDIHHLKRELDLVKGVSGVEWTPEVLIAAERVPGIQYGKQTGYLVKVGDLLIAFFDVVVTNIGNYTGEATPSLSVSGLNQRADRTLDTTYGNYVTMTGLNVNANQVFMSIRPGKRYGQLRYVDATTGTEHTIKEQDIDGEFSIYGMFVYINRFGDIIGAD